MFITRRLAVGPEESRAIGNFISTTETDKISKDRRCISKMSKLPDSKLRCPLCLSQSDINAIDIPPAEDRYFHCSRCDMIFAAADSIPGPREEKKRYLTHDNTHESEGYVRMLTRFMERAVLPFAAGNKILEFGCGPGPVLADLLRERGFHLALYDPYFAPRTEALRSTYDVITSTEVLEHIRDAAGAWRRFHRLLPPGGLLAVMTRFHPGPRDFPDWWYRKDSTHIRFYSRDTFLYIERHFGWEIAMMDERDTVALIRSSANL